MPPQIGVMRGRPVSRPRRDIAMAIDWQGDNDDKPTVVFVGATTDLLKELFDWLCAEGRGLADGYMIECQHSLYRRQGYSFYRMAVMLEGYHERFASVDDVLLLCQSWLSRHQFVNGGHVDAYTIEDLLNLQGRDEDKIIKLNK